MQNLHAGQVVTVGKACLPTLLDPMTSGDVPEGLVALDTEEVGCEGKFAGKQAGVAWRENSLVRHKKRSCGICTL